MSRDVKTTPGVISSRASHTRSRASAVFILNIVPSSLMSCQPRIMVDREGVGRRAPESVAGSSPLVPPWRP